VDTLKDIRKEDEASLKTWLQAQGAQAFRARQILHWIWLKGADSFDVMSDLSLDLREKLKAHFCFRNAQISLQQQSRDKTIKVAFKLYDGNVVEGVLIPAGGRMTACVSSQVGCSLDCKFCATGYLKRQRNLEAGEIVDQVRLIGALAHKHYGAALSNVVYMGMGEPLLNYQEVVKSIRLITSPEGLGMSPQRITVSTAGITKMIMKLADDDLGVHLALSLHAANDERRSALMPINESNNLEMLAEALGYFYQKSKNRPTLEYTVMEGVNDDASELLELAAYAKRFPCKVNLIEYNPIALADFKPTAESKLDKFAEGLAKKGIIVNVRRSRGKDIDAACGQLANKLNDS
jgi:23S rRNA (adenine2503-C2)-methyltransferase